MDDDIIRKWFPSPLADAASDDYGIYYNRVLKTKLEKDDIMCFDEYVTNNIENDIIDVIAYNNIISSTTGYAIAWDYKSHHHTIALLIAACCLNIFNAKFDYDEKKFKFDMPQDNIIKFLLNERSYLKKRIDELLSSSSSPSISPNTQDSSILSISVFGDRTFRKQLKKIVAPSMSIDHIYHIRR